MCEYIIVFKKKIKYYKKRNIFNKVFLKKNSTLNKYIYVWKDSLKWFLTWYVCCDQSYKPE